jgi:hypothetical protein
VLAVPGTLTLGRMSINFRAGFNEPGGEPIVERAERAPASMETRWPSGR